VVLEPRNKNALDPSEVVVSSETYSGKTPVQQDISSVSGKHVKGGAHRTLLQGGKE
jgi:hypothetical protein